MRPRGTILALAVLAAACASEPQTVPIEEPAPVAEAPAAAAAAELPAEPAKAKAPAELPRVVYYVISEA